MNKMQYRGLALATSIASYFNIFYLFYALRRKIGKIEFTAVKSSLLKAVAASIVMSGVLIIMFKNVILLHIHYTAIHLALILLLAILVGLVTYFAASFILKAHELNEAIALLKQKILK